MGSAPKDQYIGGTLKFGGKLLMARGCKALLDAVHMFVIDVRRDVELTISIPQVEFLATMGWAVRADISTDQ